MAPSIEEQLCAAAYRILTDGRRHSPEAERWARIQAGHDPLDAEETPPSRDERAIAIRRGYRRHVPHLGFRRWANTLQEAA